jgi:hypothetical protein
VVSIPFIATLLSASYANNPLVGFVPPQASVLFCSFVIGVFYLPIGKDKILWTKILFI